MISEGKFNYIKEGDFVIYGDVRWIISLMSDYGIILENSASEMVRLTKEEFLEQTTFESYGAFNPLSLKINNFDKQILEFKSRELDVLRRKNSKQKCYRLSYCTSTNGITKHETILVSGKNLCRSRRKLKRYIERVLKPDNYKISKKEVVRYILL